MLAIFTTLSSLYKRYDWISFANVYTKSKRWTWHVGLGWLVEETKTPFLKYDLRANHCGYLLVVMWDFRWIIASDLLVRVSLNDLPQGAVVRPYEYLQSLLFCDGRWVGFVVQKDPSLSRSGYDFKSEEIPLSRNAIVSATCIGLFLPILVIRFGHNLIVGLNVMRVYWFWRWQNLCMQFVSYFISCFCWMIFKMPYANCTAVQLRLCRLGEGWSDSRVCDFLVFLNI
jgi:hypothetical protein